MKKFIAILMAAGIMLASSACGNKQPAGNNETTVPATTSVEEGKYVMQSSEEQTVYKNKNNGYLLMYTKDGKITGIDTVLTFKTEEIAQSSLDVLKKNPPKGATAEMVREGKYVVMHMSENYIKDFNDMTKESRDAFLKGQGYTLIESK